MTATITTTTLASKLIASYITEENKAAYKASTKRARFVLELVGYTFEDMRQMDETTVGLLVDLEEALAQ